VHVRGSAESDDARTERGAVRRPSGEATAPGTHAAPGGGELEALLRLQRTAGNHAVTELLARQRGAGHGSGARAAVRGAARHVRTPPRLPRPLPALAALAAPPAAPAVAAPAAPEVAPKAPVEQAIQEPGRGRTDGEPERPGAHAAATAAPPPPEPEQSPRAPEAAQAELAGAAPPGPEHAGGGTAPIETPPRQPAPDLSGGDPASGLATAAGLAPGQVLASLDSVSAAADRVVREEHERLAAAPPRAPRPNWTPTVGAPAAERIAPPPPPPRPAAAGAQPTLALPGDASQEVIAEHQRRLQRTAARASAAEAREVAHPMGEDQIFPKVPHETFRASVPGGAIAEAAPAAPDAALAVDPAVSLVARQERGEEIHAALSRGVAHVASQREEHAARAAQERERAGQDMAGLEHANAAEQAAERTRARVEVHGLRGRWSEEHRRTVQQAGSEAASVARSAVATVEQHRAQGLAEAAEHHAQGEREAEEARRQGERKAAEERQKGQQQTSGGGIPGWLGSRAGAVFDKIKQGVQAAFDRARSVARAAIERARQLAAQALETARQAIVGTISLAGNAILAIGDRMLAAFPAIRARFRGAIQAVVSRAEAAVNRLAQGLQQGIQRALDWLGQGLSAGLGLLQRGLRAAIDGVRSQVRGILQAVKVRLDTLGTFAALVRDIAANPGQWLHNLAASVTDGIRDHLWTAVRTTVQDWFSQKVDEVLGLGRATWDLLTRGGISPAQVGKMAWEGLKAAIPQLLIELLIEKLVELVVPAAGAIVAIVEAIRAAWPTVQRILQALDRFMAFLRLVRTGSAGAAFAGAVAAGAVAAIEFVANWLLQRLRGPASAIGGRIRAIARRIGRRLTAVVRRGASTVGRGLRGIGNRLRARGHAPRRESPESKLRRLESAMRIVNRALERGIGGAQLRLLLGYLKARHRLRELRIESLGERLARIVGRVNPEMGLFAHKIAIVVRQPVQELRAVHSTFRALSLEELRKIRAEQRLSIREGPGGFAKGDSGIARDVRYAKHYVEKQPDQAEASRYDYAVVVEIELDEGALGDLMGGPLGAIDRGTAEKFATRRLGRIVETRTGGVLRPAFAFEPAERPAHLPAVLPIHTARQRNLLVFKVEPIPRTGGRESENYLVISRKPDDPNDVANQLNARIARISVLGGVAGQVTPETVNAVLSGGHAA
jgi:hypothetical protein